MKQEKVYTFRDGLPYGGKVLLTTQCRDLGTAIYHAEGLVTSRANQLRNPVSVSWVSKGMHHTIAVYTALSLDEVTGEITSPEQQDMFAAKT